uniref:Cytochrome P450 n=1 Tax=Globodera pallida TaxID=36090 RepID=A0A183BY73_GLOPA
MALIIFFVLFISVFLFYHLYYKRQKLPPGPVPLPFLGNLLQIHRGGNAEDVFLQWRRQFGPIYTFWMGQIPVVCVAEYGKIVDTFVRDGETYAGRYTMPFEHVFRGEDIHGVISSSGERWREQRRFALHVLRDFGLGKNLMQDRIMLELGAMFGKIDAKSGSIDEVNLPGLIDVAVGSIINNLMFGYRFEGDKEREFWDIKHTLDEHVRSFGNPITMIWLSLFWAWGHWTSLEKKCLCVMLKKFGGLLHSLPHQLDKAFNYSGRAGKFSLEDRHIRDYPFHDCVPLIGMFESLGLKSRFLASPSLSVVSSSVAGEYGTLRSN